MGGIDFPGWLALGSYGGLACSLLSVGSLAAYALGLRRGTPKTARARYPYLSDRQRACPGAHRLDADTVRLIWPAARPA